MHRAHRIIALACLSVCVACAAEPGEPTADDERVGATDEDLTLVLATAVGASPRIESTGKHHVTVSYPCDGTARSLWRRESNGAYRRVTDLARCWGGTRRRYTDRAVRPVVPYCYRLGTTRAPQSTQACGRTKYAPCGEERPWRRVTCDGCTVRAEAGSCLDIRGPRVNLDPRATYDGVEIRIRRRGVELDCRGATLAGPYPDGTGITVESPVAVTFGAEPNGCGSPYPERLCLHGGTEIDLNDDGEDADEDPVQVRNCTIDGYASGARVRLTSAWSDHVRGTISRVYEDWFRHPTEQQCRVTQLEDCLRKAAPHDVLFDRVDIRDTDGDGLRLQSYVQDVTFRNGSVHDAGGVGAYVTYGSRSNVIRDSSFRNNDREGIALDASAFNVISGNTLVRNSRRRLPEWEQPYGQAITIFRNAWENRWPEPSKSAPRVQHAEGNRIENNEIRDHQQGVWIGFRQSVGRHSADKRGDPVYYSQGGTLPLTTLRYYRKNAEDTIVRFNTISDCNTGVVVDDDRAQVIGNWITEPALGGVYPAISVGNVIRRKAREPVYGAVVNGNVFVGEHHAPPIRVHSCAYGGSVTDNYTLEDGAWSPVDAVRSGCDGTQASLVGHLVGSDLRVAERSFSQRGGFFDDEQAWLAGDVDADGLADVVSVQRSDDGRIRVWLHRSAGDGFEHKSAFQTFEADGYPLLGLPHDGQWLLADFDGVRGDDLAYVYGIGEARVRVWPSFGVGFQDPREHVLDGIAYQPGDRWLAGPVDAGSRADLIQVRDDAGGADVLVHRSLGPGGFDPRWSRQAIGAFADGQRWLAGDVSGDGLTDLVTVFEGSGGKAMVWAHHSTGSGFELDSWLSFFSSTGSATGATSLLPYQHWLLGDVDGDDLDDLVVAYPVSGNTVISKARSTGGGLSWIGTDLLRGSTADHVWLSGRFDCGPREDLVSVGPAPAWGRVTDVIAPAGAACREVLPVGGILVSAGTFAGG